MADHWTVWGRRKNSNELAQRYRYDSLEDAEEMAAELFSHDWWCEVIVKDNNGNEVKRFDEGHPDGV